MPDHEYPSDAEDDDAVEVRRVQPYQADKPYRCPGCDHEIRVREGHVVVIPKRAPGDRRHWHTACWERFERSGARF